MLISKNKLKEIASSVGVSEIGVITAEPLYYLRDRLQKRTDEGRISPFEEENIDMRLSPYGLLDGCRSIITMAIPYAAENSQIPFPTKGPLGMVARCARSTDYHRVAEQKAQQIVELIRHESNISFNSKILSDRSPLVERELAHNAGLGWYGENCTLTNRRFGSYTALCTILVDQEMETDVPVENECRKCGRCRQACPANALIEPFILNPYRCLSYLTQAGGVFPREMRSLLGRRIYGCDSCQDDCPANAGKEYTRLPEFIFPLFPAEPLLLPLLKLTGSEFDQTIRLTSAGWRGKTTLQRNVVIALGNSGDPSALRPLARLLENDPRPLIRLHAAWALARIGGPRAKFSLDKSRQNDPEPEVRLEAATALQDH
jgi:epoxyqueuosine reductase